METIKKSTTVKLKPQNWGFKKGYKKDRRNIYSTSIKGKDANFNIQYFDVDACLKTSYCTCSKCMQTYTTVV